MPHESKKHYSRETFYAASVHYSSHPLEAVHYTAVFIQNTISEMQLRNADPLYSPELYEFNMKSKLLS